MQYICDAKQEGRCTSKERCDRSNPHGYIGACNDNIDCFYSESGVAKCIPVQIKTDIDVLFDDILEDFDVNR